MGASALRLTSGATAGGLPSESTRPSAPRSRSAPPAGIAEAVLAEAVLAERVLSALQEGSEAPPAPADAAALVRRAEALRARGARFAGVAPSRYLLEAAAVAQPDLPAA